MDLEKEDHMNYNIMAFDKQYESKYIAGAKEHGGNMWEMGLKQVVENAEDEVLDMWSYLRQIRKCMEEIQQVCDDMAHFKDRDLNNIDKIINRVKQDD